MKIIVASIIALEIMFVTSALPSEQSNDIAETAMLSKYSLKITKVKKGYSESYVFFDSLLNPGSTYRLRYEMLPDEEKAKKAFTAMVQEYSRGPIPAQFNIGIQTEILKSNTGYVLCIQGNRCVVSLSAFNESTKGYEKVSLEAGKSLAEFVVSALDRGVEHPFGAIKDMSHTE